MRPLAPDSSPRLGPLPALAGTALALLLALLVLESGSLGHIHREHDRSYRHWHPFGAAHRHATADELEDLPTAEPHRHPHPRPQAHPHPQPHSHPHAAPARRAPADRPVPPRSDSQPPVQPAPRPQSPPAGPTDELTLATAPAVEAPQDVVRLAPPSPPSTEALRDRPLALPVTRPTGTHLARGPPAVPGPRESIDRFDVT